MNRITPRNSINRIERSLQRRRNGNTSNMIADPYLACRFGDPLVNHNSEPRPDGLITNSLNTDYLMTYDITSTNSSFTIRITPTLPYQFILCNKVETGKVTTINSHSNIARPSETFSTRVFPSTVGLMDAYGTFQNTVNYVSNPSAASARVTTVAWSIMYTGTPLDSQGTLTTNIVPFKTEISQVSTKKIIFPVFNHASDNVERTAGLVRASFVDFEGGQNFDKATISPFSRSYRSDEPLHGALHAKAGDRKPQSFNEYGVYLIADTTNLATATDWYPIAYPPPTAGTNYDVVYNLVDDNYDMTDIRYSGTAGKEVSFRLTIKTCVEYDIVPQSTFSAYAKPPRKVNKASLEKENNANATLPPSTKIEEAIAPAIEKDKQKQAAKNAINAITDRMQQIGTQKKKNNNGRQIQQGNSNQGGGYKKPTAKTRQQQAEQLYGRQAARTNKRGGK